MNDLAQERIDLTNSALNLLKKAPVSGSYNVRFSYWRLPAFHNQTRLTLYIPHPRAKPDIEPFFTVSTWRRDTDLDKLRDPIERLRHPKLLKPTIEEINKQISKDKVDQITSSLSRIPLPSLLPNENTIGFDGTRYRFSFDQGYYSLDLQWWCDYPKAWKSTIDDINNIISELEEISVTEV